MKTQAAMLLALLSSLQCNVFPEVKREITVHDIIEMTRWADVQYFWGADPAGNIAQYSPDRKHFVVTLRKANLATNTNIYSVYLFTTNAVFHSGKPKLLASMRSRLNSPAIRAVKWLSDSMTLAMICAPGDGPSQVYTLNITTRHLIERTHHGTDIDQFDISSDGQGILFTAKETPDSSLTEDERLHGVIVQDQTLEDVLAGGFNQAPSEEGLFYQKRTEQQIVVPSTHQINLNSRLSFSPDGRYVAVTAFFRQTRLDWAAYHSQILAFWAKNPSPLGGASPVSQYFLFDCSKRTLRPLLDAPAVYTATSHWAADSRRLYLKTFLPLRDVPETERAERLQGERSAEVEISSLTVRRLSDSEWDRSLENNQLGLPVIVLKEDIDTSPKIFAQDTKSDRSVQLMDLNPQFSELKLGRVEQLHLWVDGIPVLGGLYLPPDFVQGRHYPLVIQTHGYDPKRFSMDGRDEWSSAFAARALAASGIIVVQLEEFENPADHDRVGNDRALGINLEDSFRNFSTDCYDEVIRTLSDRSMIDPGHVGISGFSRTVWFVSYMLTHDEKHKFRAALLTDGIDGGYFDYIAGRLTEFDDDNGGKAPFGRGGLELWMRESPDFNLNRVCIPVRLVSIEDRMAQWEWFTASRLQRKPVELVEIPGGSHMLQKPADRYIAMQGIVDWFRFWLQGYVDQSADRRAQYRRWEELKVLEAEEPKSECLN